MEDILLEYIIFRRWRWIGRSLEFVACDKEQIDEDGNRGEDE